MTKHWTSVVVLFAMLFIPFTALPQVDISSLTVRIGATRTLWPDISPYSGHMWSFYPELEIGGRFIVPCLTWGASWGYWSDGIDEAYPAMDMTTYSSSSHIVAARIGFQPQRLDSHWPIPVMIFTGVAQHFIEQKYIGGGGEGRKDISEKSTTVFLAFREEILPVQSNRPRKLDVAADGFAITANRGSDGGQGLVVSPSS